jgi:hypothetical protein
MSSEESVAPEMATPVHEKTIAYALTTQVSEDTESFQNPVFF